MDTGTHIVMGFGIGALAHIDPVVVNDPNVSHMVIIATIIGSNAPDFDTVLKIKHNSDYIRNHRGITHSIPAVLLWSILITMVLGYVTPELPLYHIWGWTLLAVSLHVFVDIFNSYGTQALSPFTNKWIALGIINIFDPYIFGIHILGFVLWYFDFQPGLTFLYLYIIIIGYYILRLFQNKKAKLLIKKELPLVKSIIICPTIRLRQYHVAASSKDKLYVAEINGNQVTNIDEFDRVPLPNNSIMNKAVKDRNVSAFLSFSPMYRWELNELENDEFKVRFIDLRYRSKGYYPFVAVVQLDSDLNILSSYTGWVYSEDRLQKKLEVAES